jgi:SsrA-binding protein
MYTKIASNRRALHDYEVLDRYEAGIELRGTEVKSLRQGHVSMVGSYAAVENGQAVLYGITIQPYEFGNRFNHAPDRPRRLLLHKREILKLQAGVEKKGYSLIPLKLYFKNQRVKVELGLCRGKKLYDKRETLKRKTADREAARAMAAARRGR